MMTDNDSNESQLECKPHVSLETNDQSSASIVTLLPFEILAPIFFMALSSYHVPLNREILEDRNIEATTIRHASQVCKYWRDVAFRCPKIWGMSVNIDGSTAAWVEEILRRSKQTPLVIQSWRHHDVGGAVFSTPKWTKVWNEIHRIRVLHLVVSIGDDLSPVKEVISQPAPLMESFLISFGSFAAMAPQRFQLSNTLFASSAPNLREVVMQSVGFARYLDLREIKLVNLDIYFTAGEIALSKWIEILSGQPYLQHLSLSFYESPSDETLSVRQILLPHLKTLHLRASERYCNDLLPQLSFPLSCRLILEMCKETSGTPPVSPDGIISSLTEYLQGQTSFTQSSHWSLYFGTGSFIVSALSETAEGRRSTPSFSVAYQPGHNHGTFIHYMLDLLQITGIMGGMSTLTVESENGLYIQTEAALAALLFLYRDIHTLRLIGSSTLSEILESIIEEPYLERDTPDATLLPNLDSLVYIAPFVPDDWCTNSPSSEADAAAEHIRRFIAKRLATSDWGRRETSISMSLGHLDEKKAASIKRKLSSLATTVNVTDMTTSQYGGRRTVDASTTGPRPEIWG